MDHLNVQWLAGDERVRSAILQILHGRFEKKADVEAFLSSTLLPSILEYLKSSKSASLPEVCRVLKKAALKETTRHRLLETSRGRLLEILSLSHLFEARNDRTRLAVYDLLRVITAYPDSVAVVFEADYLLPAFNTLMTEESVAHNQTALMHLLANLVFNGSDQVQIFSDRFHNLRNLMVSSRGKPPLTNISSAVGCGL
jgi:hypothetical protein